MIPVIGSDGWHLMSLPPTMFSPAKLAIVKVVDGHVVNAYARERAKALELPQRRMHWAAGVGSWVEAP